jgi:8-amino-7-oxononanoate synthase
MSTDPLARVRKAVAARDDAGLRRVLRPRAASDDVLELAGNDYLGLARDPRVTTAAADAARTWGAG